MALELNTQSSQMLQQGSLAQMHAATSSASTATATATATSTSTSTAKTELALVPIKKAEIKVDLADLQKNLEQSISRLNKMMLDGARNLSFSMDNSLKSPVIVVKNDQGEVIRQIPTEAVLRVAHNFDAMKGLLLNTKI
jgi:flagellar protein FlaG